MIEEYAIFAGYTLVYVLEAFVLLFIARWAYTGVYHRFNLGDQLFKENNPAVAIAFSGYLMGIILALGGVVGGPSGGWMASIVSIGLYGLVSIVLMIAAAFLCDKVLLGAFDNTKEIAVDRNSGAAFVEAGIHIANGLVLYRINQGTGPWWSGLVFWILVQATLLIAGWLYEVATTHGVKDEIERDNAAVGLAFGGALVGLGNILSLAGAGDFNGWGESLRFFAIDAVFGLLFLYIVKVLTGLIFAPGVKLGQEQTESPPNIGAGLIEAFGYIGGSFLVVWLF
jgi:uncharacterized membrane protein YjfL (UPF0719 family)